MTVSTDSYKQVLFNNGEALDEVDFNNSQKFAAARLLDQLVRKSFRMACDIATPAGYDPELAYSQSDVENEDFIFELTGGGAFPVPTGAVRTVAIQPGVIFQSVADINGNEATFPSFEIPYVTFQLGVGGGNPRIDLIECKLEWVDTASTTARDFEDATTRVKTTSAFPKTRYVQATIQVKVGTSAANPQYPALTSGFGALCAVYVPAAHATVFSVGHMRPLAIPLGVRIVDVPACQLDRGAHANAWDVDVGSPQRRTIYADAVAPIPVVSHCPLGGTAVRVLGVGLHADMVAGVVRLVRLEYGTGAPTIVELADLSSVIVGTTGAFRYANLADLNAAASCPTQSGISANPTVGDPIWSNGRLEGPSAQPLFNASGTSDRLALEIDGDQASEVWYVRWVLAPGLF